MTDLFPEHSKEREVFERHVHETFMLKGERVFLWRFADGTYKNHSIELLWAGFQLALKHKEELK